MDVAAAEAQQLEVVARAGAVAQRLVEGDAGERRRQLRQESADRVGERELALARQQQCCGAGELLGDGGDAEGGARADGHGEFERGEAGGAAQQQRPVARDANRRTRPAIAERGEHQPDASLQPQKIEVAHPGSSLAFGAKLHHSGAE